MASAKGWQLRNQAQRKPEFPSWSWIGWKGSALPLNFEAYSEDIKASLLLEDGSTAEDAHALRGLASFQALSAKLGKHLLIEADTVDIRIRQNTGAEGDYLNMWKPSIAKDGVEMGDVTDAKGFLVIAAVRNGSRTYKELQAGFTWLGIVLYKADLVLVLKNMGDHYEEFSYVDVRSSES
ncbi:hypothetical protein ACHAP5_012088 [Fusarium lateritium]